MYTVLPTIRNSMYVFIYFFEVGVEGGGGGGGGVGLGKATFVCVQCILRGWGRTGALLLFFLIVVAVVDCSGVYRYVWRNRGHDLFCFVFEGFHY